MFKPTTISTVVMSAARILLPPRSNHAAGQSGLICVSAVPAEFAAVKETVVASANQASRMGRRVGRSGRPERRAP
jgi:hypothetical protein